MGKNKEIKQIILFLIIVFIGVTVLANMINESGFMDGGITTSTFRIISSTENKDVENTLKSFAKNNNINLQIDYAGTLEIMEKLNNKEQYDAVWCSNSIWL